MQRRPPRSTLPYTLFPYTTLFRAIAETVATRAERESALAKVNAELAALRAELARAKAANIAVPDDHDYHEADTRRFLIDVLLREAGWEVGVNAAVEVPVRSEEHTSELQSLMRISYAVFCLKKKKTVTKMI